MQEVSSNAIVIGAILYVFIAVGGYLSFLGKTESNILLNYTGKA